MAEKIFCESETRVDHIQPCRMKPARCFWVRREHLTGRRRLACQTQIAVNGIGIVVWVDKVIACVVWWIDVDQLHLAHIRLLKQLQYFKVVTLDDHVLRSSPI